ncbi:BgTH12-00762, partial [Blumeria graminis f. sp. triticale]
NRVRDQLEKLESLVGSQTDIAIHHVEQSKITDERMDRMEITMYEIKTSLKVIKPRNQPSKLAVSESSNPVIRPGKGKAPARLDIYTPVESKNVISKPEPDFFALTPGEKFVKEAWPQTLLAHEINHEAYASIKSKVILDRNFAWIRPILLYFPSSLKFSQLSELP